jgi:16S rRNA (adenine1518-N6/adenine1519-N6)-dimethyltransferase
VGKLPRPNKELGQHYLKDKALIQKICSDFADVSECIIEVGPGPGVLSKGLVAHDLPYYAIELDERFREQLEELVKSENLFFRDAMKVNFEEFISQIGFTHKNVWLVSNLPYNISSRLLISFMKSSSIKYMSLMFQKEVGLRALDISSKNAMNSLGCLVHTYFEVKKLALVLPGAFHPPPRVDSMVLSFIRRPTPIIPIDNFKKFETFLRILFGNRRKQIKGILKPHLKDPAESLEKCHIQVQARAESLSLEQVHNLFLDFKNES